MKLVSTLVVGILGLNVSAFSADSPFQKFVGKYDAANCDCSGAGEMRFDYDPCTIKQVEVRSYDTADGKAFILDEILDISYIVRPLDEKSLAPIRDGRNVTVNTTGDATTATATFKSIEGAVQTTNTYGLSSIAGTTQYMTSVISGSDLNRSCTYHLTKQ